VLIRPIQPDDLPFIREELVRHWGDVGIWSIGRRFQADQLPGFVAIDETTSDERIGLVTYIIHDGGWQGEVITLSARRENAGVGAALLDAAVNAIRAAGCARAYLTTTNDNLRAIGFYQKRGWKLAALHKGIIDEARKRKAVIPELGMHGIPLRDELELELWLR
jgi:ribosomal protein S18 acetylase RimI-like enzyme